MKIKNKVIVAIIAEIVVLLILPFVFFNLAKPHEAMGVMMMFFFIINPIASAAIHTFIGKDIKKLCWFPVQFALVFLLSYWLVIEEIVLDLTIYAMVYMLVGVFAMTISWLAKRK